MPGDDLRRIMLTARSKEGRALVTLERRCEIALESRENIAAVEGQIRDELRELGQDRLAAIRGTGPRPPFLKLLAVRGNVQEMVRHLLFRRIRAPGRRDHDEAPPRIRSHDSADLLDLLRVGNRAAAEL